MMTSSTNETEARMEEMRVEIQRLEKMIFLLKATVLMSESRWRDLGQVIEERGSYENAGFCFATAARCRMALKEPTHD
jgi:predicted nuclease with TOPRIM domain